MLESYDDETVRGCRKPLRGKCRILLERFLKGNADNFLA